MANTRRVMITGSAGFIGYHISARLLDQGYSVLGVDNFSPHGDSELKHARHARLAGRPGFDFERLDIAEQPRFKRAWVDYAPDLVIHLAAQAGVRFSIENPDAYIQSNLIGGFNVLENARHAPPAHLLMASTSSVYGANAEVPFRETDRTQEPLTLYAATKGSNELMAHSYSHLFGIPTTMFRFFTVYGPWGRPDMALFKFVRAMFRGQPIDIYNNGEMIRDFTYIDDLVTAVLLLADAPPQDGPKTIPGDSKSEVARFRIVNIGQGKPLRLMDFVRALERAAGIEASKNFMPMQMGDVPFTSANLELLEALTGYVPSTPIDVGIGAFVDWYRSYQAI